MLSESKKAEMRVKIAKAAQELFEKEGYGSVSMRRLAVDVGCTPKTLYSYFRGKFDILQHLWTGIFAQVFQCVDRAASEETEPILRLKRAAQAYVLWWLAHQEQYRIVFMSEGINKTDVDLFIGDPAAQKGFGRIYELVADTLCDGMNNAQLKLKADGLICALQGIAHCHITISGHGWPDAGDLVDQAIQAIIDAPGPGS